MKRSNFLTKLHQEGKLGMVEPSEEIMNSYLKNLTAITYLQNFFWITIDSKRRSPSHITACITCSLHCFLG
jgi:hypothetical protein